MISNGFLGCKQTPIATTKHHLTQTESHQSSSFKVSIKALNTASNFIPGPFTQSGSTTGTPKTQGILQGFAETADLVWSGSIRLNFFLPLEELHQPFISSLNLTQGQENGHELLDFAPQHTTEDTRSRLLQTAYHGGFAHYCKATQATKYRWSYGICNHDAHQSKH